MISSLGDIIMIIRILKYEYRTMHGFQMTMS